jgi:hypothetical protein
MAYEATSQTLFGAYMKNMWHRGRVVDLTMKNKPFLSVIPKDENFGGDDQKVTVKRLNPMGRSANFTKAQANAKSGRGERFSVTRVSNHQTVFVENEVIEASANDMYALARVVDEEMEGAVENLVNEIAFGLPRSGGGTRGVIGTIAATNIVLATPRHARNFEIGMVLKGGTTDGTTATTFRSTPATAAIESIDRNTGTLYFAAGTFTGTNWIPGDYLSVDGDIDESTFLGKYIKGVQAWLPISVASNDSFYGVNRYRDRDRLAGIYKDYSSKSIENAIILGVSDVVDNGGTPDYVWMNSRDWQLLGISLGTRVQYEMVNGSGDSAALQFRAIVMPTEHGVVKVMGDPNFPDDEFFVLENKQWLWHTLGRAPKPGLHAPNNMRDLEDADGVEMRWKYRGNVECKAPGRNGRFKIR